MADPGRWTVDDGRWTMGSKRQSTVHGLRSLRQSTVRGLLVMICCLLLSGCLLVSGEQTKTDLQETHGNVTTTFVSAEGSDIRTITVADPDTLVKVILIVSVDSGDLRLELLQSDGSVAFEVESHPDDQVTRTARIETDAQGRIRYRVSAQGAHNGKFQLLFQAL